MVDVVAEEDPGSKHWDCCADSKYGSHVPWRGHFVQQCRGYQPQPAVPAHDYGANTRETEDENGWSSGVEDVQVFGILEGCVLLDVVRSIAGY